MVELNKLELIRASCLPCQLILVPFPLGLTLIYHHVNEPSAFSAFWRAQKQLLANEAEADEIGEWLESPFII